MTRPRRRVVALHRMPRQAIRKSAGVIWDGDMGKML